MDEELAAAWVDLHDANWTLGWYIGPATYEPRLALPWSLYAFDPNERPKVRHRSREWTAVALTEARVVQMARCLIEIGAGRTPK